VPRGSARQLDAVEAREEDRTWKLTGEAEKSEGGEEMPAKWPRALMVGMLIAASVAPASAQSIKLRLADNLPPTHFLANFATRFFMEEVTKRTSGQVTFDYYPSEQLGKAADMLTLVQNGVTDIGLVTPAIISQKLSLSAIVEQPDTFTTSCEATLTYLKLGRSGFLEKHEFAANGVRLVLAYVNPPYQLYSGKREIRALSDLSGMKLRSPPGLLSIVVQKLGAVPVRTSTTETYEALSRGTVDGLLFPVPTVLSYDLQAHIKFYTEGLNFGSASNAYVISEAKWRSLPEGVRAALDEVGEAATRRGCEMTDADVAKSYAKFQELGIKKISFNDEERAKLKERLANVSEEWAKGVESRGKPAKAGLASFAEAMKELRAK